MFGEHGCLASDGEKIQCHVCGKWFRSLAPMHLERKHQMSADEYRKEFGLNKGTGLISELLRQTLRETHAERLNTYPKNLDAARVGLKHMEPREVRAQGIRSFLKSQKEVANRPEVRARMIRPYTTIDWNVLYSAAAGKGLSIVPHEFVRPPS